MKVKILPYYVSILLVVSLLLGVSNALASDVTGAEWHGEVRATNNGTAATNVAVPFTCNTSAFIANYYAESDLSDVVMQLGGSDTKFMPGASTNPWIFWINAINADSNLDHDIYSGGASGGTMKYFPGSTGMTVSDAASLELSDNGSVSMTGTWVDTSQSLGRVFEKEAAFKAWTDSGNITFGIYDTGGETGYLIATANGTYTQITTATSNHWNDIDDPVGASDNSTTYVTTGSTSYLLDTFTFSNTIPSSAENITVTQYFLIATNGAGTVEAKPIIMTESANTTGSEQTHNSATFNTKSASMSRPGGGDWQPSDFDSLEYGIYLKGSGGGVGYCTQTYLAVSYYEYDPQTTATVASGEHALDVNIEDNTADGWLSGYDYRIPFTVDADKIDSDLDYFPVKLNVSAVAGAAGEDITVVFDEVSDNWSLIAITLADGEEQVYIEVNDWNDTSENGILYFSSENQTLSHTTDTQFYLYFDADAAANTNIGLTGSTVAENVWNSNYVMVQHMSDNTTSTTYDSTSNDNDGDKKAANEPIEGIDSGGYYQNFDGNDDDIKIGDDVSLDLTGNITIETIFNIDTLTDTRTLLSRADAVNNNYLIFVNNDGQGNFVIWIGNVPKTAPSGNGVFTTTTKYYMAGVYNQTNVLLYKDGALFTTGDAANGAVDNDDVTCYIGSRQDAPAVNQDYFDGKMYEVWVSNTPRSTAWLKASYNSAWDYLIDFIPDAEGHYDEYEIELSLDIDGVQQDRAVGVAVPDNANDWTFGDDDTTPYIGTMTVEVDGVTTGEWDGTDYHSTTSITDDSGNGNTGTATYRTTSSDSDVSADFISLIPTDISEVDSYSLSTTYTVLSENITEPTGMFSGGDYSKLPSAPITEILTDSSVPEAAWWLPFIFLGICIFGFLVYGMTTMQRRRSQGGIILEEGGVDGSLIVLFVVLEGSLVVLGKMGPLEYYPAYLFPLAGLAIILSKKHFSWG